MKLSSRVPKLVTMNTLDRSAYGFPPRNRHEFEAMISSNIVKAWRKVGSYDVKVYLDQMRYGPRDEEPISGTRSNLVNGYPPELHAQIRRKNENGR